MERRRCHASLPKGHITTGKKNKGEAYMLLAEVLQDLGKLKLKEEINLLELSVKFEPEWVSNHYLLSHAYEKMENLEKAIEHMNIAIKNLVDETSNWSISQYYYESFMTGRVSVRNYLEMDLKEMIKKLNKKKKKWSLINRKKRRKPG
jgi:tetratricopeptide (TPR) repeat protein